MEKGELISARDEFRRVDLNDRSSLDKFQVRKNSFEFILAGSNNFKLILNLVQILVRQMMKKCNMQGKMIYLSRKIFFSQRV